MITHEHTQLPTVFPFSNRVFTELNRYVNEALIADECEEDVPECTSADSVESISNDESGWKLRLELPGYRKDEVKISVAEGYINIVAETEDEERSFLANEERQVKVSDDVDSENIVARLEEGILYLEIPRKAKPEPKVITVS